METVPSPAPLTDDAHNTATGRVVHHLHPQEVASYDAKGALAQYTSSRSCQKAIDAADTALRGALMKLSVSRPSREGVGIPGLASLGFAEAEKYEASS